MCTIKFLGNMVPNQHRKGIQMQSYSSDYGKEQIIMPQVINAVAKQ